MLAASGFHHSDDVIGDRLRQWRRRAICRRAEKGGEGNREQRAHPAGWSHLAYALFAHCFTCSKDTKATAHIATALAGAGIAVLRFDFTGLGSSEGEFANTNFSSNVDDLVAAADFLRREYRAPKLLVGHSLGGAAVIAAAGRIGESLAVATINAPADPAHILHALEHVKSEIETQGEAEVELAGRRFRIRKHFLDDVSASKLTAALTRLKRALIVFHAPRDGTVGIENAAAIFTAAKHPKSFVSLDDADHLLTDKADARYVGAAGKGIGASAPRQGPRQGLRGVRDPGRRLRGSIGSFARQPPHRECLRRRPCATRRDRLDPVRGLAAGWPA